MESLIDACITKLTTNYGSGFTSEPNEVILHLLGIKIWNMELEEHLSLTKRIKDEDVHCYTKNFLTLNGFMFSNLTIGVMKMIRSSEISPIMLVCMLKST